MWQKNDSKMQPNDEEWTPEVKSEEPTERAVIGPSIRINGELSGSEELLIQGQVQGTVDLKQNSVTVGQTAKVKAEVFAKVIQIEGEVQGDLCGEEQIVLHSTANVQGNLVAPRVSLQDGARFKGKIDMDSGKGPKEVSPEHSIASRSTSKSKEALHEMKPGKKDVSKSSRTG